MSEESNNQQPVEAAAPAAERPNDEARPTEQRSTEERRPRRRFPRRRGRNRERFDGGGGSGAGAGDFDNRGDVSENGDHPQSDGADTTTENGEQLPTEPGDGVIEISGKGFGFLRDSKRNFVQTPQDIFVTPEIVRRFALRDGMWIEGEIRRGSRGPQLTKLLQINGQDPDKYQN